VEQLFKTLATIAGLKPERVHPHALCHSAATRGMQKGYNPAILAAALGHTPAVLMATYSHVRAADAREALAGLLED
jgi:integrase/recombinase XerD